jgi:hypothetical protein
MTIKELKLGKFKGKDIDYISKKICGKHIGSGFSRDVYELKDNPRYVVKIEKYPEEGNFCNAQEWRNWIDCYGWLKEWLCPCIMINETGQVLIQKKVRFLDKSKYPNRIPNIFSDLKYKNGGFIGNRFVFVDYPSFILTSPRMKKAKWWE